MKKTIVLLIIAVHFFSCKTSEETKTPSNQSNNKTEEKKTTTKPLHGKDFWDKRYANEEFIYGKEPNAFFKQELDKLTSGKILLPADGEGRNSVYAATKNWDTYACDLSSEGKSKAMKFAKSMDVSMEYKVGDFGKLEYEKESFDVIALIYAHFPAHLKSDFHKLADTYLKKGGYIIFEGFGKKHLQYNSVNPKAGGPRNIDVLFSVEELKNDFPGHEIFMLEEVEIELTEGDYHNGKGSVVRFIGKKK